MADPVTTDRARGALLGLAVGDALGTTLEFAARDSQPHHSAMTGGGPFRLPPGVWTDDTSMTLALADSLVAHPAFDARDLMDRFVSWWQDGAYSPIGRCFDIGNITRGALSRYRRNGDPFAGPIAADTAGNGSLMRVAPVALHTLGDPAEGQRIAAAQSRTTHGASQAVEACQVFTALLHAALAGAAKEDVLAPRPWDGDPTIAVVAAGGWRGRTRAAVRSGGYVVHTLEAALWCVAQTASFADAVVLAVNLADDSDTVGAVTGQLAGALYGMDAIPADWLAALAWRERLLGLADTLIGRPFALTPGVPMAAGPELRFSYSGSSA